MSGPRTTHTGSWVVQSHSSPKTVFCCHACRLRVLPLHQADPAWRFQDFLKQQRQQARSQQQQAQQVDKGHSQPPQQRHQQQSRTAGPAPWRDLYYLTWGHVTVLYCTACHQHFPARQYSHCSFHPLAPLFASEADAGQYPCCGRPAWRPGLAPAHCQGCCETQHQAALQVWQPSLQKRRDGSSSSGSSSMVANMTFLPCMRTVLHVGSVAQLSLGGCAVLLCHSMDVTPCSAVTAMLLLILQEGQHDIAVRTLQLLQRFGGIISEPYMPPPAPPQRRDAVASAATAAGFGCSSESKSCSNSDGSSSSRPGSRGGSSLPLLVRMTNRSSPRAAVNATSTRGANDSSSRCSPSVSPRICQAELHTAGLPTCSRPGTAGAAAAARQAGLESSSHTKAYSSAETASPAAAGSNNDDGEVADVLEEASTVLDYRSAHLRSFMEAVHATAQCRGQGSSMAGLAAGNPAGGVLPGNTFSAAVVDAR